MTILYDSAGKAYSVTNPIPMQLMNSTVTDEQALPMKGNVAHDAVDAGNPVKIGGKAETTAPAAVADADRVDAWFDQYGRLVIAPKNAAGNEPGISSYGNSDSLTATTFAMLTSSYNLGFNGATWDRKRVANLFKYASAGSLANGAAAAVWTPAAGKKPRIMGLLITCQTAGEVAIKVGPSGSATTITAIQFTANQATFFVDFGQGRVASASNDIVEVFNNTGAVATIKVTAWGTEE